MPGGLLGGTWPASFSADLGNGLFDGAHLVQNFEYLNPANSNWDKYYHVFANADTEPARFVEFERWWSSYYLMNRDEIEWITRNLFIGNKLWSGDVKQTNGKAFDLRDIKSPIILFASLGDNITPPQQAFNWVADVYRSTEEIKAGGHVIVGLVHEDAGHLGIFVSGKVHQKETRKLVEVMEAIELLQPGIYGMEFTPRAGAGSAQEYDVSFREYRIEDIIARGNPIQRQDERPFEAVQSISEFNQRAYELFARPIVQATANEWSAKLLRHFHPLRARNWAVSDAANPWLAWLGPAAQAVKAQRATAPARGRCTSWRSSMPSSSAPRSTISAPFATRSPKASSSPPMATFISLIWQSRSRRSRVPSSRLPTRASVRPCGRHSRGSQRAAMPRLLHASDSSSLAPMSPSRCRS